MANYSLPHRAKNRIHKDGISGLAIYGLEFSIRNIFSERLSSKIVDSSELSTDQISTRHWSFDDDIKTLELKQIADRCEQKFSGKNYKSKPWEFTEPLVAEVPNVMISGVDALPITEDGRVLGDVKYFDMNLKESSILGGMSRNLVRSPTREGLALLGHSRAENVPSVSCAAVLNTRESSNFFNWMIYALPKIRGVRLYEKKTNNIVKLIIPPNIPKYVRDFFELIDIDDDDLIIWKGNTMKVEHMIVPSFPEPTPGMIDWMRKTVKSSVECTDGYPDWIYISRQKANRRKVKNYEEFEKTLGKFGIKPVVLEDQSLEEQFKLFNSADGVIGLHGAGFTNLIWGENMKVIEIFPEAGQTTYCTISNILNYEYRCVVEKPVNSKDNPINRDVSIDLENIENIMGKMGFGSR
ncbi:glycosyltransferase family 61 protein [Natronorubrum bangense]|nr:glycosyltransferase family 61 protein [Natronorubrum bangense]